MLNSGYVIAGSDRVPMGLVTMSPNVVFTGGVIDAKDILLQSSSRMLFLSSCVLGAAFLKQEFGMAISKFYKMSRTK